MLRFMSDVMERLRETFGTDFDLVRPLGQGSFAEVFLARETALDRPVAVKVLKGSLARDETARKRFLREARLAARIHHPNVLEVHRVGELESDGRPYLVMEYIDGRTYEDILAATGPLDEDEVRHVLVEVCGALEAAHKLGIIHRDIRPGNIMRTRDGDRILLADFGLAGILETGGEAVTRLTAAGEILGDVRYAPPEQLRGETIRPGSDVYALAVTAYELLTGNGPFPEVRKPARLIRAHLEEEPVPVRRLRPATSVALEDILLRCLNKGSEQRPAAGLLRKRLAGGGGPGNEGALGRFFAELKRRRVYKVGAAYGAFILVVLAFVDAALPALPFDLPDGTDTAIVMGTLAGLPVALVLGWFYDITASGVQRTASATDKPGGYKVILAAGLIGLLALTGFLAWFFLR